MDIKKIYEAMEQELSSEAFKIFYQEIISLHQIMDCFQDPKKLRGFLHYEGNKTKEHYEVNDQVLHFLISLYQQRENSQSLACLLLILFQPGLMKVYYSYQRKGKSFPNIHDPDIWSHLVEFFLEVLAQKDLLIIRQKVSSKIVGKVKNKMRDWFRTEVAYSLSMAEGESVSDLPASTPSDLTALEMILSQLVMEKIITRTDKEIILATRIENKNLKELACDMGMKHEALRKRRFRVEKAVRDYLGGG